MGGADRNIDRISNDRSPRMQLYWGSGSPFAWRAMLGLVLEKQPFESTRLELSCAGWQENA